MLQSQPCGPIADGAARRAGGKALTALPGAAVCHFFQQRAALTHAGGGRGGKRNDGLAGEVIVLYEIVDRPRRNAPPDRIANEHGVILIPICGGGLGQGNPLLEANPGGAPCNVLAMLEKLGKKTAFIGKVGKDMFGEQLKTAVEEVGIDTRNLVMDEEVHTTLAFVHTYPDGDRDFSFYRNPGADMMLKKEEVDEDLIRGAKIFHFGTLSSTHEGVREATRYAIDVAKEAGCIVSFDPNLRPPLWKSLDEAKAEIEYGLSKCDILKISDNEVEFLFGTTDYDEGARLIREKYQIPLVLITLGKDGSRAYYKDLRVEVPGFVQEHTIETTGAGDTFCANSLNYILEHGMEELTEENLKELLTFANAAASLITTRKGALRVMPTREEIKNFIQNV